MSIFISLFCSLVWYVCHSRIPGSTIFNDILARDNDKPNTPNSDVHYSIIGGNERGKFSLEDTNPASLLLRNPLDYDAGDTHFVLTILASVGNFKQSFFQLFFFSPYSRSTSSLLFSFFTHRITSRTYSFRVHLVKAKLDM